MGASAVLLKGGHFDGADCIDLLYDGTDFVELRATRRPLPPNARPRLHPVRPHHRRAHAVVQHSLERPRMLADGIATPGELRDAIAAQRMDESGA